MDHPDPAGTLDASASGCSRHPAHSLTRRQASMSTKSRPSTTGRVRPPLLLAAAGFFLMAGVGVGGAGSGQAWADLAPPQTCTAPGQPCQNAGPNGNDPGLCTTSTCQKTLPAADGGFTTTSYTCNLCTPSGSGGSGGRGTSTGGAPGTGGSQTGGSGTGGTPGTGGAMVADGSVDNPRGNDSGCMVAAGTGDQVSLPSVAALLGLASALAMRRPRPFTDARRPGNRRRRQG